MEGGGLFRRLMGMEEEPADEPIVDDVPSHGDERYLALKLKKKHQMLMLKKMLAEAGYDDLAKMTTISKHDLEDDMGD